MRRLWPILLAFALAGCAGGPHIDTRYRSVSQDSRVQFLIIHFTGGGFPSSLQILTQGAVSSHYLINDHPPTIYRLVDDSRRAFHAGESYWKGNSPLNASSIGIELVNPGPEDTSEGWVWPEYPQGQIDALIELLKNLAVENGIRPGNILGHSDIAPQRKIDPGPKFPWKRLADAGLLPWPEAGLVKEKQEEYGSQLPDVLWFQQKLAKHGYAISLSGELDKSTVQVLIVFQMKYRPSKYDGTPDAETAALLEVLTSPPMNGKAIPEVPEVPKTPN